MFLVPILVVKAIFYNVRKFRTISALKSYSVGKGHLLSFGRKHLASLL